MEIEFSNFNPYQNITFLQGDSPAELEAILKSLKTQFQIISIYAVGSKHVAWISGNVIKKKNKKEK